MEIIIGLVFLIAVGAWIYYRMVLTDTQTSITENKDSNLDAPYKIETPPVTVSTSDPAPEPKRCGCGRSASGFCVGLHQLTPEQWAEHPDNPRKPEPPVKKVKAKKQTTTTVVEKPSTAKKTATRKTATKKPKA